MKIFRAEFQQPKGDLNKMGLVVPKPVLVEIRQHKGRARITAPPSDTDLIPRQPSVEDAQREIARCFERQLSPWIEYIEHCGGHPIPKPAQAESKKGAAA